MSTARDPLEFRRAAFRDALRRADPIAAARAAGRLNAHAKVLSAGELLAARETRLAFGRAIRDARWRRTAGPVPMPAPRVRLRRPTRARAALAAALFLLAIALGSWLTVPIDTLDGEAGGGGAPEAAIPEPVVPVTALSRGRVVLAVQAIVVVATPQPTSSPDPVSVVAPTPAVGPSSGPSAAPGTAAPGGGAPGPGGGGGGGGGNPSASPFPTFARRTPVPPLLRGMARLSGTVIDASTGRGLPDACVSLGPCTSVSKHTDAYGRWTFDLPVGAGALDWGLEFAKGGYTQTLYSQRSRSGYIYIPTQQLAPTG
jgi:hypothetical protein